MSIPISFPSLPIPRLKKHYLAFIELVGIFCSGAFCGFPPPTQATAQCCPTSCAGAAAEAMLGCCMLPEKNPTLNRAEGISC